MYIEQTARGASACRDSDAVELTVARPGKQEAQGRSKAAGHGVPTRHPKSDWVPLDNLAWTEGSSASASGGAYTQDDRDDHCEYKCCYEQQDRVRRMVALCRLDD